jgi:hypothetical protein
MTPVKSKVVSGGFVGTGVAVGSGSRSGLVAVATSVAFPEAVPVGIEIVGLGIAVGDKAGAEVGVDDPAGSDGVAMAGAANGTVWQAVRMKRPRNKSVNWIRSIKL